LFFDELKVDATVVGDGEIALIDLLGCLDLGKSASSCPGVRTRGRDDVAPRVDSLDDLPDPDRKYLEDPNGAYRLSLRRSVTEGPFATIMASRGCPHRCDYCLSGTISAGSYRRRTVNSIVAEMQRLQDRGGVAHCAFYDDCFFPSGKTLTAEIAEFAREIDHAEVAMTWQMEMRPDVASCLTSESLALLEAAGCRQINLGIETARASHGDALGKATDPTRIAEACRLIAGSSDISLSATFILGGPGETLSTADQTIEYSLTLGLAFAHFYPLELYPGTKLWESINADRPPRWWYEAVTSDSRVWGELLYESLELAEGTLLDLVKQGYHRFYEREEWQDQARRRFGTRFASIERDLRNLMDDRFRFEEW